MIIKILFIFCFITFGDSVRKFNGFTVYRINPQTDQQLEYLKQFSETQHEIDFWTYPSSIGRTVDVMVDPNQKSLVENFLREKSFKYEVMIQDLEKLLIDVKGEPKAVNRADPFFDNYQRLSVIEQYVDNLVQQNPSIASKQIYGQSTQGRDLTVLKLQYNTSPKPIVFIDATIHAREWITTTTTLWFVQTLIDGVKSGNSTIIQLLNDFDFHIVPVVNPDGYEYSHTNDRMWRKTRSTVSSTTCPGVDGNRNYNHSWTSIGSSSNPCSTTFHGSAPNSEPEVKSISDYMLTIGSNIKLYIAVHSYGQYMLSPWGYTTALPPNNADLSVMNNIEDINQLSNGDVKDKLENSFGFSCGPITQSTRAVYLKKLVKLIDEKNGDSSDDFSHKNNDEMNGSKTTSSRLSPNRLLSQRNSPRRRLGDESDTPLSGSKTSTPKTKRQSIAVTSQRKSYNQSPKPGRKSVAVVIGQRTTVNDGNNHLSQLSNYSSETSENDDNTDDGLSAKATKSPRKRVSTPPYPGLQDQLTSSQRVPFARPYPPPPLTPAVKPSKSGQLLSLTRPPIRRPGLVSGTDTRLANYSDSEGDTEQENDNIRDRLLRHRPGLNISSINTSKPLQSSAGYEENASTYTSSNFISFAILLLVVLFFVFIFSFYFYTRISSTPKTAVDLTNFKFIDDQLVAPICQSFDSETHEPNSDSDLCLKHKTDIMPALTIVKEIKTFVDKTLFKYYCGSTDNQLITDPKVYLTKDLKNAIKPIITVETVGREGLKDDVSPDIVFGRDFANAVILISLNPNWQMVCNQNNVGEIEKISISDEYSLSLPFGCHLLVIMKQNIWTIYSSLVAIFLVFVTIIYYRRSKRIHTEEQDLVYDLVEKSIELLQSPDNPQSMPVLHIRDTLLSAAERKTSKFKKIWQKVVKHIEMTESRVKVEVESIEGDDYKTWKWVAMNNINCENQGNNSTIIKTGGIEWQGQAFAIEGNVSQLVSNANNGSVPQKNAFTAPTVYLKIRNMFDKETIQSNPQNWKRDRRSAVLEKVSIASKNGRHSIVHMEIEDDSNEGLIYLKCDAIESATDAFNALHGWWCEKKLVSVKFLKSDRYYHRFPEANGLSNPITS